MLSVKVSRSIEIISSTAQKYTLPFVLGFSGGKDSTATLSLLIKVKEQGAPIQKLYVVYADTLLEQPALHREALDALQSLRRFSWAEPVVLKPAEGEDFITMILDRGYPAPSWYFRWCTDRLKIKPVRRFMKRVGRSVKVLGVRADESAERQRTVTRGGQRPALLDGVNPTLRPIIDWAEADVFEYLKSEKRWDGRSFDYLLDLYGYQIEDSCTPNAFCPVKVGNMSAFKTPTNFTSVRFGCWVCTVVKRNKMPVSPMLESVRERLMKISSDTHSRIYVDGKPRKLTVEARIEIAKLFIEALEKEPDAFAYDREALRKKLERFIAEHGA